MSVGATIGITTGLTRGQFLAALFSEQGDKKLTDEELVGRIRAEFPKSTSNYQRYIRLYRNIYNRGGWPSQAEPPVIPVPRFEVQEVDGKERRVVVETTSGPPPRMPWQPPKKRK